MAHTGSTNEIRESIVDWMNQASTLAKWSNIFIRHQIENDATEQNWAISAAFQELSDAFAEIATK